MHRAVIEINEKALQGNLRFLQQKAPASRMLAVLKANAYGHGLIQVAQSLQEVTEGFGVACLNEALQLRQAGITNKIVVLEGGFSREEYLLASEFNLDMVIHDEYQHQWLATCFNIKPIHVWLKVNTGMNRLGVLPEEVPGFLKKLKMLAQVKSVVIMSHLASADQLESSITRKQHAQFKQLVQLKKQYQLTYSLANSAGILGWPDTHYDWIRPGLALYGISPFKKMTECEEKLCPVMTLKAKIIAIRTLKKGDCIGYHGYYQCTKEMRIGLISFGYGDGYPYNAPSGTPIFLKQQRLSLVGQVSMDMLAVDVSVAPHVCVGDEVTLWGEELSLKEVACYTQRSCYELLCGIERKTHNRLHVKIV